MFPSVMDSFEIRPQPTHRPIFSDHWTNNFSVLSFPRFEGLAGSPCTVQLQRNMLGHCQAADGYRDEWNG